MGLVQARNESPGQLTCICPEQRHFPSKNVETLFFITNERISHSPRWSATIDESIGLENVVPGTQLNVIFSDHVY